MPQLTSRAIVMGSFLGGFMSLSNLYVGLKTGWGLGVSITSCILSFAIHRSTGPVRPADVDSGKQLLAVDRLRRRILHRRHHGVSAISAYLIITGHHIHWTVLSLWTFFLAAHAVFLAVPMKRQMINVEQLRFPTGVASAEVLRSLHAAGGDALLKARALGVAGLIGTVITWLRDARKPFGIPDMVGFPGTILIPTKI